MDFLLSKIINRPKSIVVSSADQMIVNTQPEVNNSIPALSNESPTAIPNKLGTKKSKIIDTTVGDGVFGNGGDCCSVAEDQVKTENVIVARGDIRTDKAAINLQQTQLIKPIDTLNDNREITSSSDNYNATVLPDIINVQPNLKTFTEAGANDSLILSLASNLGGLQISTPKGKQNLGVPPNATNCDVHSGVSSDDEVFSECNETVAMGMDGELNQSNHWKNIVSSVSSACDESLENTLEQIEPLAAIDVLASQDVQNRSADSTITSTEQIRSTGNKLLIDSNFNTSDNEEIKADTTCNLNSEQQLLNDFETSGEEAIVQEQQVEKSDLNISDDAIRITKSTSSEIIMPEVKIECVSPCYSNATQSECLNHTFNPEEVNSESSPTVNGQLVSTFSLSHAEPVDTTLIFFDKTNDSVINPNNRTSTEMPSSEEQIKSLNISYNIATQFERLNETFNPEEVPIKSKASPTVNRQLDSTFALSPTEPLDTTVNLFDKNASNDSTFADNKAILNGTFATSGNIMSDCITKMKEEKSVENELRAAASDRNVPEPMDIDENLANQLNSTHQLINISNTPKKTSAKIQDTFVEDFVTDKLDVTFKVPSIVPPSNYNKRRSYERMEPTDADFTSNGLILNSSDFDFLLSKGNGNREVERNSLLLRFDPLLGHPVSHQQPLLDNTFLTNNVPSLITKHLKGRLSPAQEEEDSQHDFLQVNDQSDNDTSKESLNSTVSNSRCSPSANTICSLETKVSASETNDSTTQLNFQENQKLLKDRINQNQPEDKKGNVKMSVDVIQDMKIDNDVKSIDKNINSQTDEKQEYKMAELEKKIKNEVLKTEDVDKKLKEAEQREEALLKRITEKDKTISKMSGVLEAYEKAIAELIAEKEQIIQSYEKQMMEIKSDRDLNYQHLTSLEATFSDLHAKYERSKQITATLKASEEDLLAEKRKNLENLRLQEQRYEKMKNHAMQQLEIANNKLESLSKNHSSETTKLKALLKKEEISRLSLTEQLQQKTRESEELVKICDELINGQGS